MKVMQSMAFRRVVLLVLLVLPCLVAWWSVTYRLPLLDRTKHKLRMLSELDQNINIAQKGWTEEKAATVDQEWNRVHSEMIGSYEELASWLEKTAQTTARSGYTLNYHMENPVHSTLGMEGLSTITITIDLRPRGRTPANYLKTIAFTRALVEGQMGVHLDNLILKGAGEGLNEATLTITLWVAFVERSGGKGHASLLTHKEVEEG